MSDADDIQMKLQKLTQEFDTVINGETKATFFQTMKIIKKILDTRKELLKKMPKGTVPPDDLDPAVFEALSNEIETYESQISEEGSPEKDEESSSRLTEIVNKYMK